MPRSRRLVLPTVLGLAVAGLGFYALNSVSNPLEEKVVDRSTTPLLLALDDLHEYHAATGTFQVVIDQERDTPWVPAAISGERTQLMATGTVDAYVDFAALDAASDLLHRAEDNTRAMLTGLARSLGVEHVTVTFAPDPA